MIKPITVLLLFFHMLLAASSQSLIPPAFEIKSDSAILVTLPEEFWQVMEDREGNWSVDRLIIPGEGHKFHADSSRFTGIDYSIHTFWVRYRLKNMLNQPLSVAFSNTNAADKSVFYFRQAGRSWTQQVTGLLYPLQKRDGLKDINMITLRINSGETVEVYNRVSNNYYVNKPKALNAGFGITEKILENEHNSRSEAHKNALVYEIFNGIYFFGMVLNFLFFIIVRERIFLYYALFLTYLFYSWSSVWPDFIFASNLTLYNYLGFLINPAGIICYIQFLRYFLRTFEKMPRWDRALNLMSIALAAVIVVLFFVAPRVSFSTYDWLIHGVLLLAFSGLFMILATLISSRNRKDRPVGLLLLSGLPVVIWETFIQIPLAVKDFLAEHYDLQTPSWIESIQEVYDPVNRFLMAWLAIVFCWMLFQRFLNLQRLTASQALEKERLEKQKEMELRTLIEQQKINLEKTVEERTSDLKQTLKNLKSAQSQLIQSEKMASLGELTAGIAHEIQNPLNFVNNFSEVNKELIDEMKQEMDKGNLTDAKGIARNIRENEEKINQHGKRADAIVKGMLQHSRTSSGQKEPTDINALADEYLRLAYHGLRAKDNSFNVSINTDFDNSIGKINIMQQDIGRALLNLYNNAFYAVNEKAKLRSSPGGYEPRVTVGTGQLGDHIEIRVQDNGNGIPSQIREKIFQPFFTTKPTGQGTGLGLSLSYDIIKAHGGEIKVESKEGEGSEFIITL
jgi:signal transduction histidine kinase